MYELALDHYSPLSSATYDPESGELYLEFDYDRLLDVNGEWRDGRHIDAVTFMGEAYPIIIHADDGPRDENGRFIFNQDTVDNIFTLDVGVGHDPADGALSFALTDREDGTGELYTFELVEADPDPAPNNQAPVTVRDDVTVGADDSILLDVLANDSDPDGDPLTLTFAITEGAADVDVTIEDNQLRIDPIEGGNVDITHTITYTVEDAQGATSQGLAVVTIDGVDPVPNQAPIAVNDAVTINYTDNILFDVLANDNDPEGGALTLVDAFTETVVSIDVSVEDNQVRLDPVDVAADRIDAITYIVEDEQGERSMGRLIVTTDGTEPGNNEMPTLVQAVNAGGSEYTAANGITYQADTFANGSTFSTTAGIEGTEDDTLYQTEKWSKTLEYELAVENGTYDVELNFAEIWGGAQDAGKRVVDLYVEDELVFEDLDLADDAGFLTALDIVGEVSVTDGALNIRAEGDVQNAKLAGFSVWESEGALGDSFAVGSLYDDLSFA